jgi:hypothetical protein
MPALRWARPPEEHERDIRYTGASLPESEDWIEQLKRNLDGV